ARYNDSDNNRNGHDPFIGRPNNTIDARMIARDEDTAMQKYGSVFPMMYDVVPSGAMRTCSIVPRSFSRTTESEVDTTDDIMPMYAMSPGTRKSALRSSGLYQTRGSTLSAGPVPRDTP